MIYNHSETERIFKELGYAFTKGNCTLVSDYLDAHTNETIRGAVYWLADKLVKTPKTHIEIKLVVKDILVEAGKTPIIYDRIDVTVSGDDKATILEIIKDLKGMLK